jgi:hypothetical protein
MLLAAWTNGIASSGKPDRDRAYGVGATHRKSAISQHNRLGRLPDGGWDSYAGMDVRAGEWRLGSDQLDFQLIQLASEITARALQLERQHK